MKKTSQPGIKLAMAKRVKVMKIRKALAEKYGVNTMAFGRKNIEATCRQLHIPLDSLPEELKPKFNGREGIPLDAIPEREKKMPPLNKKRAIYYSGNQNEAIILRLIDSMDKAKDAKVADRILGVIDKLAG